MAVNQRSKRGVIASVLFAGVSAIDIQFHDRAFRRIEEIAQQDLAVIAENEEKLDAHVQEWYQIVARAEDVLGTAPETKAISAVSVTKNEMNKDTASKKADSSKAEFADLQRQMAEQHAKSDHVRDALNSVMGPAMMVPVLQEMYGKFKGDIKRATQQEQKAKDRVKEQEAQFVQWQKEGKTYLLADKKRVIDYYKRQRDIQHKHYHSMLKMAHSMMERIKMVKGMCGKASKGEALSEKEKQELSMMAPNKGK